MVGTCKYTALILYHLIIVGNDSKLNFTQNTLKERPYERSSTFNCHGDATGVRVN
jgi:hypothetical protein